MAWTIQASSNSFIRRPTPFSARIAALAIGSPPLPSRAPPHPIPPPAPAPAPPPRNPADPPLGPVRHRSAAILIPFCVGRPPQNAAAVDHDRPARQGPTIRDDVLSRAKAV